MSYLILLFGLIACSFAMRDQSVSVTGQFLCGTNPADNVHVLLYEEEPGNDADVLMDEGYTSQNGRFTLKGNKTELTPLDPILYVYHDCGDGLPGSRKIKFGIPKLYLTNGLVPLREFNMGSINLENIFYAEERVAISPRRRRFADHSSEMKREQRPLAWLY